MRDIKGSKDIVETVQPVAPISNPLFHQVNQIGTHPHLSVDSAVKIIDRCVHIFQFLIHFFFVFYLTSFLFYFPLL